MNNKLRTEHLPLLFTQESLIEARIHCEIFLSEYP